MMATVSLQPNVSQFAPTFGSSCNRQPTGQEASEFRTSCNWSASQSVTVPGRTRSAVAGSFFKFRFSGAPSSVQLSSIRDPAIVQLSKRTLGRQLSASSRQVAARAEQGQKARERESTDGPVQNVLKEIKDKRGVEAVKAGAEAAKKEAEQDLDWYRGLNKPWFAPPEPVYGIVWSGLYALMAVATWMVITEGGGVQKQALPLAIFGAQLFLNFRWPQLFFVDKKIGAAQIDNLFLLASLLLTYQLYHNVSPTAGLLILPSVVWVGFANVLNYVILVQNKDN